MFVGEQSGLHVFDQHIRGRIGLRAIAGPAAFKTHRLSVTGYCRPAACAGGTGAPGFGHLRHPRLIHRSDDPIIAAAGNDLRRAVQQDILVVSGRCPREIGKRHIVLQRRSQDVADEKRRHIGKHHIGQRQVGQGDAIKKDGLSRQCQADAGWHLRHPDVSGRLGWPVIAQLIGKGIKGQMLAVKQCGNQILRHGGGSEQRWV